MVLHIILADILLIARIFPRPFGARKNTTQLAKYPRVLYVKPSNKIYLFILHACSRVYYMYELTKLPVPSWFDSSVGRALPQHCRGHGFGSRSSLDFFFRLSFRNCLGCGNNCQDLSSVKSFICRSNKCFIYSYSFMPFLG